MRKILLAKILFVSILLQLFLGSFSQQLSAGEYWTKVSTSRWYPIILIDASGTALTGKTSADTTIGYACNGATSLTSFTDSGSTFKEVASGIYFLNIGASEFTTTDQNCVIRLAVTGANDYRFMVSTASAGRDDTTISVASILTQTGTSGVLVATNAIGASQIAADAIGASEIAADAIGASEIAADAVGASEIATDAIGTAEVATDAIGASEIAANAITSSEFAQSAADLAWGTSSRVLTALDEDSTAIDLDGTTIGTVNNLAANSIAASTIAADAIGASEIADGAIDAGALATDTITAAKIAASAITSSEAPNLDAAVSTRSTLTAANVWDTDISAYTGTKAGTYIKGVFDKLPAGSIVSDSVYTPTIAGRIDVAISTRSSHTAADVWAVATRKLTELDEDNTTIDLNGTTIGTVTNVSDKTGYALSASGVDAIWDEVQSGHTTSGTFGKYLDAQVSLVSGDSISVQDIVDGIWDEPLADHDTSDTMGITLSGIKDATDGDKEGLNYTGIENMIRTNR